MLGKIQKNYTPGSSKNRNRQGILSIDTCIIDFHLISHRKKFGIDIDRNISECKQIQPYTQTKIKEIK